MNIFFLACVGLCGLFLEALPINVTIKHVTQTKKNEQTILTFYKKVISSNPLLTKQEKTEFNIQISKTNEFLKGMFPKNGKQFGAFNKQTDELLGLLSINKVKEHSCYVLLIGGPVVLSSSFKHGIGKKLLQHALKDGITTYGITNFYTHASPCCYCNTSLLFCDLFGTCGKCVYSWFVHQGFEPILPLANEPAYRMKLKIKNQDLKND